MKQTPNEWIANIPDWHKEIKRFIITVYLLFIFFCLFISLRKLPMSWKKIIKALFEKSTDAKTCRLLKCICNWHNSILLAMEIRLFHIKPSVASTDASHSISHEFVIFANKVLCNVTVFVGFRVTSMESGARDVALIYDVINMINACNVPNNFGIIFLYTVFQ